jgi:hypothetical protein
MKGVVVMHEKKKVEVKVKVKDVASESFSFLRIKYHFFTVMKVIKTQVEEEYMGK